MKRNAAITLIASFFVLLFAYAALSKLETYQTFSFQLSRSPFITRFASLTAWSLPLGEILTALALVIPATRLTGLYASLFLMTLFTAYIFVMTHYSYYTPCSCGGILSKMNWTVHFYFNIGCLFLALIGIWLSQSYHRKALTFMLPVMVAPVVLVYLLYAFTYQPNKGDNGFRRSYAGPAVIPTDTLQGTQTYGLLCGVTPYHFYVESAGRKNQVFQFDWALKDKQVFHFGLPPEKKIWSRLYYQVDSPGVHLFAGNGPDVFKGTLAPGLLLRHHYPMGIFMWSIALPNDEYLLRGFASAKGGAGLSFIRWIPGDAERLKMINPFPASRTLGLESDGTMDFDTTTGQLVFIQFYKNGILVLDSAFHPRPFIPTIDTVLHARTSEGTYQEDGNRFYSSNTPLFFVNWNTDISGGLVYVNSLLRADNEDRGAFESYSDLDVYSLKTYRYQYSIKVPRLFGRKLISFKIEGDRIAACYPDGIVTYRVVNTKPSFLTAKILLP